MVKKESTLLDRLLFFILLTLLVILEVLVIVILFGGSKIIYSIVYNTVLVIAFILSLYVLLNIYH